MKQAKKKSGQSRNNQTKKTEIKDQPTSHIKKEIISVILLMLAVFVYVSITKARGIPEDAQFIGLLGTYITVGLETAFGEAALLVAFYLLFWSIHIGIYKKTWSVRMWGVSLLFLTILVANGLYNIPGGLNSWEAGTRGMGGGYLGGGLAFLLTKLVGQIGAVIILSVAVMVSLLMIICKPMGEIAVLLQDVYRKLAAFVSRLLYVESEEVAKPTEKTGPVIIDHIFQQEEPAVVQEDSRNEVEIRLPKDKSPEVSQKQNLELVVSKRDDSHPEYQKPPFDLLSEISSERTVDKKNIKESVAILEETFSSFGINVRVNQVSCGPAVTRYELSPGPGVKVSRILSLTDDLQLNLAAPGIRIEAPIPGKSAVGIEVPNRKIMSVGLKNLLLSSAFSKKKSPLTFALGEDISGNTVVASLNDMPHLLIAGSTGSGKSVCLNCIIMSLLYNTTPEEMRLVFIDPKMVELTVYNGIPHLLTPVVTDPKKAAVVLRWMATEMEKRYKLFAEKGVRDINRYNQVNQEKLPYIVIVIDELADLMMVAPVEVEDSICRLAQMARAAGMYLIVATQRPSVDVVTGVIKANIPSRIAFAVSSQADSRTILDSSGAEKLLGKGDMLFLPVGASKPFRVQGAFVSDSDIEKTVNFIKQNSTPPEEELKEVEISLEYTQDDMEDELFWDAVRIFVEGKKASVSLLQRRLRIGYARAARLVDLMEEKGMVSEQDNNKKREILIDSDQLERLYANNKL